MSSNHVTASPTAIDQGEKSQYTLTLTAEPISEELPSPPPPHTQPSDSVPTTPDAGYVPRGHHRHRDENGVWTTVKDPVQGKIVTDAYESRTFMEHRATVQIVTFHKVEDKQAEWANQLIIEGDHTEIQDGLQKLRTALRNKGDTTKTWRWIHCEGLHGQTMKTIAKETGWPLDQVSGIFAWTRPSAEWAHGCLRVHFQDQSTFVWLLYREDENNPVFITCTKLEPREKLRKRWEDFVDFGDSRPNLLLRKDPSLMLYAMIRAVIQDLRYTTSQKHKEMTPAYNLAMSQPSQRSLQYFYELEQNLIRIKLDTTSLRDAAMNLIIFVENMQKDALREGKTSLVSADTQYMLRDQLGLITLLLGELPEVTRQAEAVGNLAFNSLSFNTNNLLRLLAVLTIASVPLTVVTGILGINYFQGDVLDGRTIAIVVGTVAGAVVLGLLLFFAWGYSKLCHPHYRRGIVQRDSSLQAFSEAREAEQRFADLEAQNQRLRISRSPKDEPRPDHLSVILESAKPPTRRAPTLATISEFVRAPWRQPTETL